MAEFSPIFIEQYEATATHEYSSAGVLFPWISKKVGVVGSSVAFPFIGSSTTVPYVGNQPVVGINISSTQKVAPMLPFQAAVYLDPMQQTFTNVELASSIGIENGKALKRRQDQVVLDAMNAGASSSFNISVNTGGTNSSLNIAKISAAWQYFNENSIPYEERYLVVSAASVANFMQLEQVSTNFWNSDQVLATGRIDTYNNWKFIIIPSMTEGGLPYTSNIRTNYALHGPSVGIGINYDIKMTADRIPDKNTIFLQGTTSMGSVVINPKGVIKLFTYE